jgi:hypothetical protein
MSSQFRFVAGITGNCTKPAMNARGGTVIE